MKEKKAQTSLSFINSSEVYGVFNGGIGLCLFGLFNWTFLARCIFDTLAKTIIGQGRVLEHLDITHIYQVFNKTLTTIRCNRGHEMPIKKKKKSFILGPIFVVN